jgi:hypothetical protein
MTTPAAHLLLPGTIGLTSISGRAGALIHFGQWLATNPLRRWFSKNTEPKLEHAFIYLGPTAEYPEGAILEAEPGGSRIRSIAECSYIYWCCAIATHWQDVLASIALAAREDTGIPYSFLDYLSLLLLHLCIRPKFVVNRVAATHHQICSELVDWEYSKRGAQLFRDKFPGDVMPIDLWALDQSLLAHAIAQRG